jgi:hypothetical protein
MDKYEVIATKTTPYILLDPHAGELLLSGESWPENAMDVFHPLFEKLDEYLESGKEDLRVEVKLDYHNTSSQKMMRELIFRLQRAQESAKNIALNLYYLDGDTDMMEDWEELMDDITMNYRILERTD